VTFTEVICFQQTVSCNSDIRFLFRFCAENSGSCRKKNVCQFWVWLRKPLWTCIPIYNCLL